MDGEPDGTGAEQRAVVYRLCRVVITGDLCAYATENSCDREKPGTTLSARMGLDAFVLFKNPRMAIFFFFAMMLGAVLQITNVFGNPFLHDFARNPAFADSFVVVRYPLFCFQFRRWRKSPLFSPFLSFLKRFGIKTVMLMSMLAWTLRWLFAFGDPSPFGFVLLLMSMIVYGCAFDFFNISGSVFVEQQAGAHIRASAQGCL